MICSRFDVFGRNFRWRTSLTRVRAGLRHRGGRPAWRQEPASRDIDDFFDYTWALINALLESQQNRHLHSDDWQRTVYIDSLGVGTTDFDLDDATKEKLVESGRTGVRKYFEWFDNSSGEVVNRPAVPSGG